MAGVELGIDVDDSELERGLRTLLVAVGDLEPVFRDIGEYLLQATAERFEREEPPDGDPWAPLSPRYRRHKRGPKILTERGHLRNTVFQASADGLLVGTPMVYGATQHLGRDKIGIPARPFLGLSDEEIDAVDAIIREHIVEALPG